MEKETITLSGRVESILHQNEEMEFCALVIKDSMTRKLVKVAGTSVKVFEGDSVSCEGIWSEYRGEPQFKASQIVTQVPMDTDSIKAFLASGRIKNISKKMAARLVKAFGRDTLDVIEHEPEKVLALDGFGKGRLESLQTGVTEERAFARILAFLHQAGLPHALIKRIYKSLGSNAVEILQKDPYKLMEMAPNLGFSKVDSVALQLGVHPKESMRIEKGIFSGHKAFISRYGHMAIQRNDLFKSAIELLNRNNPKEFCDKDDIEKSLQDLFDKDEMIEQTVAGKQVIYTRQMLEYEDTLAEKISHLLEVSSRVSNYNLKAHSEGSPFPLDKSQIEALSNSLSYPVSVITGGPGMGKSTILKQFLTICLKETSLSEDDVLLCAPTGKAAKRMTESTGFQAKTIHRALKPDGFGFYHGEEEPLSEKIIVVDEASMLDCEIGAALLSAVDSGAHLVIVGDVDQLPSIGPGRVLADLIESKVVPCSRLTEIHRQGKKSNIIKLARKVASQKAPDRKSDTGHDVWFIQESGGGKMITQKIVDLIPRLAKHYGFDPVNDIQVLTPQRKGGCGLYALNYAIKKMHNNTEQGLKIKYMDQTFQFNIGDKVLETVNRGPDGPFNGDVGIIKDLDYRKKKGTVQIDDTAVNYDTSDFSELLHAYAMTIHKSQGSEYPCVIVPITMEHRYMLNWKLFYTALTRAKAQFVMVGEWRALLHAIETQADDHRISGLKEKLIRLIDPNEDSCLESQTDLELVV